MHSGLPRNVQATFREDEPTKDNFLIQAHPNPKPYPVILNRDFHTLIQPTDKASFFINRNKSGTSTIGKSSAPTPDNKEGA
jgi:hypothetical protein